MLSINTLEGRIKVSFAIKGMEQYFDGSWSFGIAKLVTKYGKYFLHIPMTKEIVTPDINLVNKVVGIDLGINFLATAYDSKGKTIFFNGRTVKHKRAHYEQLRKKLQQKGTRSARKRLRSMGSRENRWVCDLNHKITKALVNQYGPNTLFVIEDLTGMRSAAEKVHLNNRYTSVSWAFYQFRSFLEYKAAMSGSSVIAVDPKYTSQTCPKCGHTEKANRDKKKHIFKCKTCSYTSNDDRIGAMNLWTTGIEYVSKVTLQASFTA
ncbi:transposase [Thermanaerosceptrum fracticalcis]|uniref:RNA-guided endonuclease InsQ/TnpB family protein n=1 Tax=Thermanaerosceptrum fracticalcis TaxID=1712410 RepID=UPI000AFD61B2